MTGTIGKVALLWRGDPEARNSLHPRNSRLEPVFEALAARNIYTEPAVYSDDWVSEVRSVSSWFPYTLGLTRIVVLKHRVEWHRRLSP